MQVKTTIRYYSHLLEQLLLKSQKVTNPGKDVEKRETFFVGGENVNWYSHQEKIIYVRSSKKLKVGVPVMAQWKQTQLVSMRMQV